MSRDAPGGFLDKLGLHRKELRAWAMYDWANSAFATTVMAAVLPIYYQNVAGDTLAGEDALAFWGYTAAAGLTLAAVIAPVLGAVADFMAAKKKFLAAFMLLGVAATFGLGFVGRGEWLLASVLYVLGNVGFAGSIVFYASLLPHIASDEEVDRVATGGWAVGYVGGGLLLAINAVMLVRPDLFGLADQAEAARWAFVSVAVWWALFSLPLFRHVREPPRRIDPEEEGLSTNPFVAGFRRLGRTFREVREYRQLSLFLAAFFFYTDGIGTIIKMAGGYGAQIGIGTSAIIGALLMVQFVGVPFTFAFGALSGRIGPKNGILIALVVYAVISVSGYFVEEAWHFWVLAFAVGTVQGGAQALSRGLFASMVPRSKSSEFFGFFSVFEKMAGIMGPVLFGFASQSMGTGRYGIVAVVIFFLAGIAILRRVDVDEARRVARKEDAAMEPAEEGGRTAGGGAPFA